jgi:hypothetical protein
VTFPFLYGVVRSLQYEFISEAIMRLERVIFLIAAALAIVF